MPGHMDPLGDIPSGSESDSDDDDEEEGAGAAPVGPAPAPRKEVDYAALQKAGYSGAPSIMAIKEKHGDGDWGWSQGSRGQIHQDDDMTRDELRNATNEGLQEACGVAIKAAQEDKKQRERDRADRASAIENRRRIERETRDALRADKRGGGGGGGGGQGQGQGQSKDRDSSKDKTFRAKEKRKREWGQQSSGKNWVEEEKRLLKHSGAGGFGFD